MLITNRPDYKLRLTVVRQKEYVHVTLARWLPELDWIKTEMFLSAAEYDVLKLVINTFH